MKKIIDDYEFDFPNALELFKFDSTDKLSEYYHGVSVMKAVDAIAKFRDFYLWIEIKCYPDANIEELAHPKNYSQDINNQEEYIRRVLFNLTYKYRDTYLYRYAENKIDKPIYFVCLLNLKPQLLLQFYKELKKKIPMEGNQKRWKRKLIDRLFVVSEAKWQTTEQLSSLGTCKHI